MVARTLLPLIKRARAGNVEAQFDLGKHYLEGGKGVSRNPAAAAQWLVRAYQAGHSLAGRLLIEQVRPEECDDAATYQHACQELAQQGAPRALAALAARRESDGLPALDDWLSAAQGGDVEAMRRSGELLLAENNTLEARRWLSRAAEAGDARSAVLLADLLWQLRDSEARKWLEITAASGDAESMYRLGDLLVGEGEAARLKEGMRWLKRAVGLGHGRAMRRLASIYAPIILKEDAHAF